MLLDVKLMSLAYLMKFLNIIIKNFLRKKESLLHLIYGRKF